MDHIVDSDNEVDISVLFSQMVKANPGLRAKLKDEDVQNFLWGVFVNIHDRLSSDEVKSLVVQGVGEFVKHQDGKKEVIHFKSCRRSNKLDCYEKSISEFPVLSFDDFRNSDCESITYVDLGCRGGDREGAHCKPYILHVKDAILIPSISLNKDLLDFPESKPLPPPYFRRNAGGVVVSGDGGIFNDSFRWGAGVHDAVEYHGKNFWKIPLNEEVELIDKPCVFIDLVCRHFGHALMDTPARLWVTLEEAGINIDDVLFVGFGTHQLGADRDSWPNWLKKLLCAYGVDLSKVLVL